MTDPVTGVRFYLCHKDDPNRALLKNVRKNKGALTGLNMMPRHHASESVSVQKIIKFFSAQIINVLLSNFEPLK